MNTSNHLTVELHSKVTGPPIKFSKIVLRFNENSMNQEITGDFTLVKGTPFKVEREKCTYQRTIRFKETLFNLLRFTLS